MPKQQKLKTLKRRRREKKTDYKARLNLLKSGIPRVVIRKTNRYINVQHVKSKEAKDKVILGVTSRDLLKFGWPKEREGSLKSVPACYLTGFLMGKKMEKGKVILDIGLSRNIKKGRIYAVLKGLVDAGVDISFKEEIFPDEKRLKGEHLKNKIDIKKVKEKLK